MQATVIAPATAKFSVAAALVAGRAHRAASAGELPALVNSLRDAEAAFGRAVTNTDSVLVGREPTAAEERAWDAASDASDAAADALREYPAQSLVELAEKARVLSEARGCTHEDIHANSEAVLADLERLAALASARGIMRAED